MTATITESESAQITQPPDAQRRSGIEVQEWHGTDVAPQLIDHWSRLFEIDAAAGIDCHPRLIQYAGGKRSDPDRPRLLAGSCGDNGDEAAAALIPVVFKAGAFGRCCPYRTVRGHQLLGNRIPGDLSPKQQRAFLNSMLNRLTAAGSELLIVEDVQADSPWHGLLTSIAHDGHHVFHPWGFEQRHRIRFPDSPSEYWKSFSKNSRKRFRNRKRRLEPLELVRVTERNQVDWFIEKAVEIDRRCWQFMRYGPQIVDDDATRERFLLLADLGVLRSYILLHGETPVSYEIATHFRGVHNAETAAFDVDFSDRSPGQVCLVMILEDLCGHDTPEFYDFGVGDMAYKQWFANCTESTSSFWIAPRGSRSRAVLTCLQLGLSASRGIRRAADRFGLLSPLRQLRRRTGI